MWSYIFEVAPSCPTISYELSLVGLAPTGCCDRAQYPRSVSRHCSKESLTEDITHLSFTAEFLGSLEHSKYPLTKGLNYGKEVWEWCLGIQSLCHQPLTPSCALTATALGQDCERRVST